MPDYQQLRRERETIDTAARALRSTAIADGYAGLQHKAVAFGFALILDELSGHWAQIYGGAAWCLRVKPCAR